MVFDGDLVEVLRAQKKFLFHKCFCGVFSRGLVGQIEEDGGEQKVWRRIGIDDGFSSKAPECRLLALLRVFPNLGILLVVAVG